jgi:type I restriction enzyme, S subunit
LVRKGALEVIEGPMKPYPDYKDSEIPWLGRVPERWQTERLDRLFSLRSEPPQEDDDRVTGYLDGRVTLRSRVPGQKIKGVIKEAGWQRIHPGDFAISGMNAHLGGMGVSDALGKCSPIYLVLKPASHTNARFVSYAVRRAAHSGALKALVNTIRFNSADFKRDSLKLIRVPLPSHEEQAAIVRFLDHADRRIRRYIAAKRKLTALLNEQKQAIIHQAVTRGLDPKVRLKPSGVSWLGDIPSGWRRTKLRNLCRSIRDGTHNPPIAGPGRHRLLSVRNIQGGRFATRSDDRTMSENAFAGLQRSYTVEKGDVVLALVGATTGKSAVVDEMNDVSVQRSIGILRPKERLLDSQYLNLFIASSIVQNQIRGVMDKYAAQPGIYLDDVGSLQIVYPDLATQRAIVRMVGRSTSWLDAAASNGASQIDLAVEYRTCLISNIVTGKLDVREAAAGLPDEQDEGDEDEAFQGIGSLLVDDEEFEDPDFQSALETGEA